MAIQFIGFTADSRGGGASPLPRERPTGMLQSVGPRALPVARRGAWIPGGGGGARHTEEWDTLLINRVRALWIKALDEDGGDDEDDEEAGDEEEGPVKTRYVKDFTGSVAE